MTSRTACGTLLTLGLLGAVVLPIDAQRAPTRSGTGLPSDVLALACAPSLADEEPLMPLRIMGGQDSFKRYIYLPGDLVTINGGSRNGIQVGQDYYVRRMQAQRYAPVPKGAPVNIHTAGWIRVYAIDDEHDMALATVTHACDGIEVGDYLEPFVLPRLPTPAAEKPKPQKDNYGRIMEGLDRRQSFGRGDFLIVDRGSNHGVMAGDHFVIYRDKKQDHNFLYEIGEAMAVRVQPGTSTLQVVMARDGVSAGDYVALRRQPEQEQ